METSSTGAKSSFLSYRWHAELYGQQNRQPNARPHLLLVELRDLVPQAVRQEVVRPQLHLQLLHHCNRSVHTGQRRVQMAASVCLAVFYSQLRSSCLATCTWKQQSQGVMYACYAVCARNWPCISDMPRSQDFGASPSYWCPTDLHTKLQDSAAHHLSDAQSPCGACLPRIMSLKSIVICCSRLVW